MIRRVQLLFVVAILTIISGTSHMGSAFAQDSTGGTIVLSASSYTIPQSDGSTTITVERTGGSSGESRVSYHTGYVSALDGIDFANTYGVLSWSDGDTTPKTFSVPILSREVLLHSRSFSVSLDNARNAVLGVPAEATVTILPNEASTVAFSTSNYTVAENAGSVTVTVDRANGGNSAASVRYQTRFGSALNGVHYLNSGGSLDWPAGDVTPKSFNVPILDKQTLTSDRSFTVSLFDPSAAAIGSQATATVTITPAPATSGPPNGGTGSIPSAVSNLTLTNQGGSKNNFNMNEDSLPNSQTIAWDAATAGTYPIAYYQIYRNGAAYATTTALTYTDSNATNSNDVQRNDGSGAFNAPRTVYSYNVAAVDSHGNVGPQAARIAYFEHSGGVDYWGHEAFNPPSPAVIMNWTNQAVAHGASPSTVSVTTNQSSQYLQPYSAPPSVPLYSFEAGAFANGYMQFDVYPTKAAQQFKLNLISRVAIGDLYNNAQVYGIGSNPAYSTVPLVQNAWNHIKIPMGAGTSAAPGLQMGVATFQGYISGKVLTVTSISKQIQINASMWVSAPGMTTDYIASTGSGSGTTGTYNLNVSQNVGSASAPVTFTGQRTNLYKWSFQDTNESGGNLWYMDNLQYTSH